MSPDGTATPMAAFGTALTDAASVGDWPRAETILAALDTKVSGKLKSAPSADGDAFLEFAVVAAESQRELAKLAIEIYRRAWPTANSGIAAEQGFHAQSARRDADRDYAMLDHAAAMAEYVAHRDAKDISGRVRAHVAALRAFELRSDDSHTLASLAASTRFTPDMSNEAKRAMLTDVVDRLGDRVGVAFLVSVAAMLIDMGAAHSARRVLDEVEGRSPNNRNATMVRARLASMKGDNVEAEHLGRGISARRIEALSRSNPAQSRVLSMARWDIAAVMVRAR